MNKIKTHVLLFFAIAGIQTIKTNNSGTTINWDSTKNALSSIASALNDNSINSTTQTIVTQNPTTTQSFTPISTSILSMSNSSKGISKNMVDKINADNASISSNTSVDSSSNPLNADILKCQVTQDLAFIGSIIYIYLANYLINTPSAATILYTREISCSDTIGKAIIAVAKYPAESPQSSLLSTLLAGNATATLPTNPITITITQTMIYGAICAFVLAYDANSTSGPYQSIITNLIAANNALQIL